MLFLDEPTSGLDATSTLEVLHTLRTLADSGKTIIMTIHQPRVEAFHIMDNLILLAKGGYLAYYGPTKEESVSPSSAHQRSSNERRGQSGRLCGRQSREPSPANGTRGVVCGVQNQQNLHKVCRRATEAALKIRRRYPPRTPPLVLAAIILLTRYFTRKKETQGRTAGSRSSGHCHWPLALYSLLQSRLRPSRDGD